MNHSLVKHKQLYSLLKSADMMKERHTFVSAFSEGRTENSAELTDHEIDDLIGYLKSLSVGNTAPHSGFMEGDKMRKRLLSLCHQYGWTKYDVNKGSHIVDYEILDNWMLKYSYLHKPMNKYSYTELPKLITQFENMVHSYLTSI